MNRTYVRLASYPFPRTLMDGYKAFKSETLATDFARYRILAETGQKPDSCIISCCDSRAVPETVFSLRPGQLFVVRNVANLVPPYEADDRHHGTSAAIEFAVQGLRVRNLVVMGHGKCGGVAGFIQPASLPQRTPVLSRWMHLLEPANRRVNERRCVNSAESCSHGDSELELEVMLKKDRTGLLAEMTSAIAQANTAVVSANIHTTHNTFHIKASGWENLAQLKQSLLKIDGVKDVEYYRPYGKDEPRQKLLELESIVCSVENLNTFPVVAELCSIGELQLFGAWFDIATGELMTYSLQEKKWSTVD